MSIREIIFSKIILEIKLSIDYSKMRIEKISLPNFCQIVQPRYFFSPYYTTEFRNIVAGKLRQNQLL